MAYKIFSRFFPKGHPRKGQPTYFIEKIWAGFYEKKMDSVWSLEANVPINKLSVKYYNDALKEGLEWSHDLMQKLHYNYGKNTEGVDFKVSTIRAGKSVKQGDLFEPRCWIGKPRKSKQFTFAPTLKVYGVHDFECVLNGRGCFEYSVNGRWCTKEELEKIGYNDGLCFEDFMGWFAFGEFSGQIIVFGLDDCKEILIEEVVEPKMEDYGWIDVRLGFDGEGGWCVEGGEEAYYEALEKHKKSQKL